MVMKEPQDTKCGDQMKVLSFIPCPFPPSCAHVDDERRYKIKNLEFVRGQMKQTTKEEEIKKDCVRSVLVRSCPHCSVHWPSGTGRKGKEGEGDSHSIDFIREKKTIIVGCSFFTSNFTIFSFHIQPCPRLKNQMESDLKYRHQA